MQFNENMKRDLSKLLTTRLENPSEPFVDFATQLEKVGIQKQAFDALKDEILFYTKDEHAHTLVWEALKKRRKSESWQLGNELDTAALKEAIDLLDTQKIDAIEFHRRMFLAGVIFCHVYFTLRSIYYMGQDGKYYLEKY